MKRPSISNVRSNRQARRVPTKVRELVLAELAMEPLLKQIASLAVRLGITPKEIANTLKLECVREAARHARLGNGRVNHSRVAVATGLTRAETRKLLAQVDENRSRSALVTHHRAWHLVTAWLSDSQSRRRGVSRQQLSLRLTKNSFAELTRKYCGDIPEKAVLEELVRIGAVVVVGDEVILKQDSFRQLRREIGQSKPVIRIASDLLQRAARGPGHRASSMRSVVVPLASRADQAVKLQQIQTTLAAALAAIKSLGERPIVRGRSRSGRLHTELNVSAIVTACMPTRGEQVRSRTHRKPK